MTSSSLSITIVTYSPCYKTLSKTLCSLGLSIVEAKKSGVLKRCCLTLVDNGPGVNWQPILTKLLNKIQQQVPTLLGHIISGQGNVGFGHAHNLAAKGARTDYLLVLNPDVILEVNTISEALRFMEEHNDIGILTPNVRNERNEQEFLCKRYPSVTTLGIRGFMPPLIQNKFGTILSSYEMRDIYSKNEVIFDIPLVSGCFMFCRHNTWLKINGFSRQYFMYFEDFDLSLRLREISRIAYVPMVKITHLGGGASRKGWQHIYMFMRSALTFFNQHGWRVW